MVRGEEVADMDLENRVKRAASHAAPSPKFKELSMFDVGRAPFTAWMFHL